MVLRSLVLLASLLSANLQAAEAFTCRTLAGDRSEVMTVETTLAGVPAIVRVPRKIEKTPIVLWHGFGPPASEQALMDALPLDDVPSIKVYLGLPLFGRRAEPGGTAALKQRQDADVALRVFEPIVVGAAKELSAVVKALQAAGCVDARQRIGLFGFSAGGASVLYALAEREAPIGSAVVLNASTGLDASVAAYERAIGKPYAWSDAARDLARRTDAVRRAPDIAAGHPAILIVQGTDDAMLTPELATALHASLAPLYKGADGERERLVLEKGLTHDIAHAAHVDALRNEIGAWFNRFLDVGAKR